MADLDCLLLFFFFNDTATTEIYTLSLHDALPICGQQLGNLARRAAGRLGQPEGHVGGVVAVLGVPGPLDDDRGDRKSTRLNSSHANISYAVFCLKKKKKSHQYRLISLVTYVSYTV